MSHPTHRIIDSYPSPLAFDNGEAGTIGILGSQAYSLHLRIREGEQPRGINAIVTPIGLITHLGGLAKQSGDEIEIIDINIHKSPSG